MSIQDCMDAYVIITSVAMRKKRLLPQLKEKAENAVHDVLHARSQRDSQGIYDEKELARVLKWVVRSQEMDEDRPLFESSEMSPKVCVYIGLRRQQ
jgi:hypothetical protein